MSKQKSYATATRVKHDNAVASLVPNIASERANCLSFTIPKGTKVSIPDVAQALEKLGNGVECFVPLIEDGTIILQVIEDSENSRKLVHMMIEDGLPLKVITAVIAKLPQAVVGGDRIAGRVQEFTPTPMGIAALKSHLEKFGDLISFRLNHFAGTRVYDRTAEFLINISQSHKLPPAIFRVDNESWAEDVKITIVTRTKFCYFCRSTEHVRKDCTEAPKCYHCGHCDHPPSRCRNRNRPIQAIFEKSLHAWPNYSRDWGDDREFTDDMAIDDFEVQREPALKGAIASDHAPGGALTAPEAQQKEAMEVVSEQSVQATGSGSPAVNQTSVPPSVSNESILGKRAPTAIDSSGFQTVTKKHNRGASSTNSPRPSPYDSSLGTRIFGLRIPFFCHYAKRTTIDIFLLSEVGILSDDDVATLTQEAQTQGLGSLFFRSNQPAILWRLSSSFLAEVPRSINVLAAKLASPNRMVDAIFDIYGNQYHFIATYVPVNPRERKLFLKDLDTHLPSFVDSTRLIIGGDWNCVQDPLLDSSNPGSANLGGSDLQSVISRSSLIDTYRMQNPSKRLFTNRATYGSDRRLDMIFVSPYLEGLVHSTYHLQRFKQEHTHLPIGLKLTIPEAIPVGKGTFKLRDDVLDRPGVVAELRRTIVRLYDSAVRDGANVIYAWRAVKTRLAYHIRDLDKETAPEGRAQKQEHRLLSQRARVPSYQIGSSSVRLRLRQVRDQDLIPSLRGADNTVLTEPRDMLAESHSFFQKLYCESEAPSDSSINDLLKNASSRLGRDEAQQMDKAFDLEGLTEALGKCNRGSCPGPDGLSFYFYRQLWDILGPYLVDYMNALGEEADPAVSHLAHISLLHKKGDKDLLNNKRPISLINTDDRILDQALNMRLCFKLLKLTHPSQTGFVPTRWIGNNIETIQQVMDEGAGGMLAFLDFDKAYDRLSHKYILAVMKNAGLGPRFSRWTMRSLSNASARVVMNGWISEALPIQRGLRQGSPLSPSLFALCVEPLAALLRKRLQGIRAKNLPPFQEDIPPLQSQGFADDMAVGLSGEADLQRLQQSITLYEAASGSSLSHPKTFLYEIGAPSQRTKIAGWRVEKEQFRYLGVQLGRSVNPDLIWRAAADRTIHRMSSAPMWDFPIHIRCLIINIYCYTKILYLDKFMPAKDEIIRKIEEAAVRAITGKNSLKVKEADLVRPRQFGGFGLRPLAVHLQCNRAGWVADLLGDRWKEQRHYGALRLLLARKIADADQAVLQKSSPLAIWTRRVQCRTTLNSSYIKWPWIGIFFKQASYEDESSSEWDAAILATRKFLPQRWERFVRAWHATIQLKSQYIKSWLVTFSHKKFLDWRCPDLLSFFCPRYGKRDNPIAATANSYRQVHLATSTICSPSWHLELQNPHIKWKAVWQILGEFSKEASGLENSFRLFLLGKLTTPASWASTDLEKWPNNSSKICLFCSDEPETRNHLLEGCRRVQEILVRAIGGYGNGFMRAFADKDIMDPDDMGMLYGRASAIHHLFTFIRSRRLSRNPLPAITANDIDILTEQISRDAAPSP